MHRSGLWRVPTVEEEPYTMNSPPARDVLAENLAALMAAHPQFSTLIALEGATATRGGGKKIGKTTLGQILNRKTPVNLDYIEILSKVFGVAPWQMLVPGLQPRNPQILRSVGPDEDALYSKLGKLKELAKEIGELERSSDREFPPAIDDRRIATRRTEPIRVRK